MSELFREQNLAGLMAAFGVALLVLDLTVLGVTGFVQFAGLGALVTAAAIYYGWIAPSLEAAFVTWAVASVALCAALLAPLRRLQTRSARAAGSDLVGQVVVAELPVTEHSGSVRLFGTSWPARARAGSAHDREARLKIAAVDGNTLIVEKV